MKIKIIFIIIPIVIGIGIGVYLNEQNQQYISEVEYEASQYNPTLDGYQDERVLPQVYIINKNDDCNILKKLFSEKTDWWSRPMLADKINRLCL